MSLHVAMSIEVAEEGFDGKHMVFVHGVRQWSCWPKKVVVIGLTGENADRFPNRMFSGMAGVNHDLQAMMPVKYLGCFHSRLVKKFCKIQLCY